MALGNSFLGRADTFSAPPYVIELFSLLHLQLLIPFLFLQNFAFPVVFG